MTHAISGPFAAEQLAAFAADLRFEEIPAEAVHAARQCLIDAVACAIFGAALPWSRMVEDFARSVASEGPCRLPGALEPGLALPQAALCLGAFAHAFELDSLRKPGAGVHPGATVALPALLAAQAVGASGKDLLRAIVASCEVMFRIGKATLHTPESLGFHAPGITGTFGAATAAGLLLGLDARQLAYAYGICGSTSAGLLAFAKSGQGGMVKRLHLGRSAEAGCTAAILAKSGFEAPLSILEGRFGVLEAFCEKSEPELLTLGLGSIWEILTLCIKHYACHVTAQAPVELLRKMMAEHGFAGPDIATIQLTVSDKVLSHHAEQAPADLMLAQYSVPYSVAIAAFRNPEDARAFSTSALSDPAIASLAKRIDLAAGMPKGWSIEMTVILSGGKAISGRAESFLGCPEMPFSEEGLATKFLTLTAAQGSDRMLALLKALETIHEQDDCSKISEAKGVLVPPLATSSR